MADVAVHSFAELARAITRDVQRISRGTRTAVRRAATRGKQVVKRNVPVAHGELRETVHRADTEVGAMIVVDAPHAAAVNVGSRPHYPPLGPLVAWVKLRGLQGLATDRQLTRLPGSSTAAAARGVASMIAGHERGGAVPIDAAVKVARAIQQAIGKHGTKPHHFIEKSLPEIWRILDEELRRSQAKNTGGSAAGDDDTGGDDGAGGGAGRNYFEGSRGGVYSVARSGMKVWVKKEIAARLRADGRVNAYKPRSKK